MKYDLKNYCDTCERCKSTMDFCDEAIDRKINGVLLRFDVQRAIRLCTEKTPIELPDEIRNMFLSVGGFDDVHVWHVNHEYPGIVIALEDGLYMIDGHHRAERCRRLEIPFKVFCFSTEEVEGLSVPVAMLEPDGQIKSSP